MVHLVMADDWQAGVVYPCFCVGRIRVETATVLWFGSVQCRGFRFPSGGGFEGFVGRGVDQGLFVGLDGFARFTGET